MSNKKTMPAQVTRLDKETTKEIIDAVAKYTDEKMERHLKEMDNKTVVVKESDIYKTVKKIWDEKEKEAQAAAKAEEEEEAKAEAEETTEAEEGVKVVVLKDGGKKTGSTIKSVLKYTAIAFAFAGLGAAGKVGYNKIKEKNEANRASESAVPVYDVSADYN